MKIQRHRIVRFTLVFLLLVSAGSLWAGSCAGSQYGIDYRIRCNAGGTKCWGSAWHQDGSVTNADLTLSEAQAACRELLVSL